MSLLVDGANESTWFTQDVNPVLLVAGPNVPAVEIHQANSTAFVSSKTLAENSCAGRSRT
jgi:hypothetical protein